MKYNKDLISCQKASQILHIVDTMNRFEFTIYISIKAKTVAVTKMQSINLLL